MPNDEMNGMMRMRPALARLELLATRFGALLVVLFLAMSLTLPTVAQAQSLFAAAVYVNDEAITNYEINQRMRFLEFIGITETDQRALALNRLIEDRLMLQEARRLGGRATPDMLAAGLAEFASRAQMTSEELLQQTAAAGIAPETIHEFIRAGVLWRDLVRQSFGHLISISNAQIEQALSVEGVQPSVEVLISELFLPSDPQFAEALQRIVPQIQRIRSETDFANAARQVSAAPTATEGGRVDRWIDIAAIPAPLGPALANSAVGSLIGPLEMPGALAFFLLRARRDSRAVSLEATELDYRRIALPGGRSEQNLARLATLRERSDSCDDFPGHALRLFSELPAEAVQSRLSRLPAVPAGERSELERMNPGQISANMVEGNALVVLMLCARRVATEGTPPPEQLRTSLVNRALEGQATIYLQRLRVEAEIRRP